MIFAFVLLWVVGRGELGGGSWEVVVGSWEGLVGSG